MKTWPVFLFVLLGLLQQSAFVHAQDDTAAPLVVDASASNGTISPFVYGSNFGPLQAVPPDLIEEAYASGIRFMRFPGGRWGDMNDIRPEQIDTFINLVRTLGAEPLISVRLENGTPEAAVELLRYTNIEKGYGVRYWSIGNEPNLFDDYTTIEHNAAWRDIAEAMLATDPDILLVGPDLSQYPGVPALNPRDPDGRDWLREFLMANGDLVDIVAVHRYPFPLGMNAVTRISDLRQNVLEWDGIMEGLRAAVAELTGRDLPIAITEANSHWSSAIGGEATPDSHYNAIWWAEVLGRLIRQQAFAVNYFDFQSSDQRGGFGLLARYDVRPAYYVYQLYQIFGTELLASSLPDDSVSVTAARRNDGAITLMIVNLSDDPEIRTLDIQDFSPAGAAEVWRFDQEHEAARLDDWQLTDDPGLILPGQSITLLVLYDATQP